MLGRQETIERLAQLDWANGFDREGLLRALVGQNIALPNEVLSAIPVLRTFASPEELVQSIPDSAWTIHEERERRALGHLDLTGSIDRVSTA